MVLEIINAWLSRQVKRTCVIELRKISNRKVGSEFAGSLTAMSPKTIYFYKIKVTIIWGW